MKVIIAGTILTLALGSAAGTTKLPYELERRDSMCDVLKETWGCYKKTCWKECGPEGSDQWCYLAKGNGQGNYIGCSEKEMCNPATLNFVYGGDLGCAIGDCKRCGCGCR